MAPELSIRILEGVSEQSLARDIFDLVWPTAEGRQITANLMQAMVHNGAYVSGAFLGDEIVAAAFAFPGVDAQGHLHLHSHMAAVKEEFRNKNFGSALKWHQRQWALEHNIKTITWTFDPLVRRNAKLNILKLGVLVYEYFENFYGDLPDALNAGDPTDRMIAQWNITSDRVERAANSGLGYSNGDGFLCHLPEDIIEIRRSDPALALKWRLDVRNILKPKLESGWYINGLTEDGAYVLQETESEK
ncbi:MAG: GNAT family N-acetyltransferase [Actinomycetota bacterium]